ncbi:hypothetical protein L227DRAFT_268577 [Lentinus tigrinus ALCF2SS1-6]|uniref:Uncharacterized protein n=1 Tax=Lentinus tigrinus ALCF2SS1-6 TaxID=1328759 RepID=A0A5C2SMD1_9APHY|nr:hypothetical protein L227DRAFT_268577 [Lentinus tigrinus ALCF2SS1-6]
MFFLQAALNIRRCRGSLSSFLCSWIHVDDADAGIRYVLGASTSLHERAQMLRRLVPCERVRFCCDRAHCGSAASARSPSLQAQIAR